MDVFKNMLYMARRFKTATALNFMGLVVALTAFYLFMTQVMYNHQYNRVLAGHERLYRMETQSMFKNGEWQTNINRMFADCVEKLPQVESLGLIQAWNGNLSFTKNGDVMNMPVMGCSDNYLLTLRPRCLSGELGWKEDDYTGIILPRSLAMMYFGQADVVGRMMGRDTGDSIRVRGVYEDFPANSMAKNVAYYSIGKENTGGPGYFSNYNYVCLVRLKEEVDTVGLDKAIIDGCFKSMKQFFADNGHADDFEKGQESGEINVMLHLRPVADTYFSGIDPENDRGSRTVDLILQLACVMLFVIAIINLLNFTLAKAPMRVKGVNTRRVLGSEVWRLRLSLVTEEVVFSLLAFAVAMGGAYLLSRWPFISELTVGSIALADHIGLIAATLAVAVAIGVVAGCYPAVFVTSFQPALAIKGSFGLTPKGRRLRTALITLQLVISCVMVVYLGILMLQSRFIFRSDYGFQKDEVMYVNVRDIINQGKNEALRAELLRLTGVEEVAYSQFVLGTQDTYMGWGRGDSEHEVQFVCMPCDWRYLRTMGIKIEEGNDFSEHDLNVFVINRCMKDACDWMRVGKPILEGNGLLVGVCENVRYASVRTDRNRNNLAFHIFDEEMLKNWNPYSVVNIRVGKHTDKLAMKHKIAEVADRMGDGQEHEVFFLDQMLEQTYQDEFRFIRQVVLFSVVCLVITLIGLFCLTLFDTEYRRKEIGIRKVMGSTTGEILVMLCRRYVWLLVGSFLVASPLVWYIGNQWLQSFAERTPIYWWLFPLALAAVAVVTLATVVIQSWRTANENPVNSIKNE